MRKFLFALLAAAGVAFSGQAMAHHTDCRPPVKHKKHSVHWGKHHHHGIHLEGSH